MFLYILDSQHNHNKTNQHKNMLTLINTRFMDIIWFLDESHQYIAAEQN